MAKKQAKTKKRLRIIIPIVAALLVAAAAGGLMALREMRKVDLVMPFSAQDLGYEQAAMTLIDTNSSRASSLCVGENNVGNSSISIGFRENGALFSLEEREVVFAKGMYDRIYPASVTKVMTAIVALKNGNMNDTVTVSWQDLELESGSQVAGLRIGDKVQMIDLMHALLVHSGNDAAMAVARHVGGSAEKFVVMMNEEARRLGATGTHFVNPTGLHDDDHYTTVYDIYLMLNEAMRYHVFLDAMQVPVYDLLLRDEEGNERHVTLDSTDHYLTGEANAPKDVSVLGGKTGTTEEAGSCLAVVAQNAYGQTYISIIMGAPDKETLYNDMNTLLAQINT